MTNMLGSYFTGFQNAVTTKVQEKTKSKAEQYLQEKSKDIGTFAQKKFYEAVYKEAELTGVVNSTGEEVTIYKTNPHLIQKIVKKITGGFDVETELPLMPNFISKKIFSKLDSILADKIGEYINSQIESLISKAAISAVYKAAGVAQEKIISSFAEDAEISVPITNVKEMLASEDRDFSDEEISDFTKMVNHYIAKSKLYLNNIIEESATSAAEYYAGELVDTLSGSVEKGIETGINVAVVSTAVVSGSGIGPVTLAAIYFGNKSDTPYSKSYIGQFSEYTLGCFWDKNLKTVENAAHNNAFVTVQKNMPSFLAVDEKTLNDAYGTYEAHEIPNIEDDIDDGFVLIEADKEIGDDFVLIDQKEAPMTIKAFAGKKYDDVCTVNDAIAAVSIVDVVNAGAAAADAIADIDPVDVAVAVIDAATSAAAVNATTAAVKVATAAASAADAAAFALVNEDAAVNVVDAATSAATSAVNAVPKCIQDGIANAAWGLFFATTNCLGVDYLGNSLEVVGEQDDFADTGVMSWFGF